MKSADYIEQLRAKTKTGSVYAVARLLDMSETTVRNYANGHREFDTYAAIKVAELLNIEPMQVIADVEAARESDEGRKRYWLNLAKKSAGLIATVIFAIAILIMPDVSHSQQPHSPALGEARRGVNHSINMARKLTVYILSMLGILSRFRRYARSYSGRFASAQTAVGAV